MKAILFLLLAITAVHAGSCTADATGVILSEEGTNILLAMMFVVMVVAAAYIAGTALSNANYIVFAKDEAYHLAFSVLMLAAFSGIVLMSCGLGDMFYSSVFQNMGNLPTGCYAPDKGMNSTAICYAGAVQADAQKMAASYIKNNIGMIMDSTWAFSIQWPLMNTYTSSAGSYRKIIANQYDMVLNSFIIPALVSVSMQKLLLEFVTTSVIQWILPSAFILRIFIPTRQMGNILIALSLGLYVLVPFMYVFSFAMYDAVGTKEDCEKFALAACDPVVDNYDCGDADSAKETCTNPDSFWNVSRLLPVAFFLPNLTIAVLITFLGAVHKGLRVLG
ncbi:hypothetical protein H0O00_03370 [Candidatus Micrarchaeota archaeon]|nr:hypothetical protein [Candidatus Micrarchaeota archaeon]